MKNVCNMHIMQELPTIKTDVLFKNSEDFIRLHTEDHKIPLSLFIISVYILSVLVLWNMFSKGHVMPFSAVQPKQFNASTQKTGYA